MDNSKKDNNISKKRKTNFSWQIYFSALLPIIGWMLLLFLLSDRSKLPGPEDEIWRFIFMKTAHILAYGALYFWLWRGWKLIDLKKVSILPEIIRVEKNKDKKVKSSLKKEKLGQWLLLLLVCIFYAMSDEYHQSFIPGRTATWRDIGFDTFGASLGLAFIWWRWKKI